MAKLYFNFGAMNAGKSTILLQAAHNYAERGMHTLLLKPAIDTRDDQVDAISCRIGLKAKAHPFTADMAMEPYIEQCHAAHTIACVFVDEAQFLTETQVWELANIADRFNIPVMCYGLRTDFRGKLFPGSAALLAIADNIKEIKTMCWCGRKATMTLRIGPGGKAEHDGSQIEIGDDKRYISLCRKHWVEKAISPKPV